MKINTYQLIGAFLLLATSAPLVMAASPAATNEPSKVAAALPAEFSSSTVTVQSRVCGNLLFSLAGPEVRQAQGGPEHMKAVSALMLSGMLHLNRTEALDKAGALKSQQMAARIVKGSKEEVTAVVAHCVRQSTQWLRDKQVSRDDMQKALVQVNQLTQPGSKGPIPLGAARAP